MVGIRRQKGDTAMLLSWVVPVRIPFIAVKQ